MARGHGYRQRRWYNYNLVVRYDDQRGIRKTRD